MGRSVFWHKLFWVSVVRPSVRGPSAYSGSFPLSPSLNGWTVTAARGGHFPKFVGLGEGRGPPSNDTLAPAKRRKLAQNVELCLHLKAD